MGYTNVRHYAGGLADWSESGGPIEAGDEITAARVPASGIPSGTSPGHTHPTPAARRLLTIFIDALADRSIGDLLRLWLGMILGFGLVYWIADAWHGHGLLSGSVPVEASLPGLGQAVYFSFVTALSIGYGDVVPVSFARALAIVEGAAGLLLFGCVISKLVSRRQEEMVEEIHRIAFEDRLGRVRTNLHLVLSELQAIAGSREATTTAPERLLARVESASTVFVGELRTIHDLLYRPQQVPDEEVLESILASLAAGLRELADLLVTHPGRARSGSLGSSLRSIARLADEICGECVPRNYAPTLKSWMDRVQELARTLK